MVHEFESLAVLLWLKHKRYVRAVFLMNGDVGEYLLSQIKFCIHTMASRSLAFRNVAI